MRYIHGKIYTIEDGIIEDGYLTVKDNVIQSIGVMADTSVRPDDIDLAGACVLPGLIDAHTCLGLKEDSMRHEGNDWNEHGWTLGAELRAADGFNPEDRAVGYALEGGVTTVAVAPGNENLIGGQMALVKLCCDRPGEMIWDPFCGLKLSVGEDAKRKGSAPCTRMAIGAMLRETFRAAATASGGQGRDQALCRVLSGEKPVFIHANRCDDIVFAVEFCKAFGMRCVIVHGGDAALTAELLAREQVPVIIGSMILTPNCYENRHMDLDIPVTLEHHGVQFAITTDHYMSPVQALSVISALTVREGLSAQRALEAVTIEPAHILGIDHRVGSLRAGKDADFVIWSGDPFSYQSRVKEVVINGRSIARFR